MVETHCYRDLNIFGPNSTPTPDLLIDCPPPQETKGCFPFRRKVKVSFRICTSLLAWLEKRVQIPKGLIRNLLPLSFVLGSWSRLDQKCKTFSFSSVVIEERRDATASWELIPVVWVLRGHGGEMGESKKKSSYHSLKRIWRQKASLP